MAGLAPSFFSALSCVMKTGTRVPSFQIGAVVVSVAGFARLTRVALTPAEKPSGGGVGLSRALARVLTLGHPVASGISDFVLWTLGRCRAQQGLIAINVAIGASVVIAGLARGADDIAAVFHPRTALLWAPLVLVYCAALGLRASFFVRRP
jgi:hypothetical protein